jgi:hypothetical protein
MLRYLPAPSSNPLKNHYYLLSSPGHQPFDILLSCRGYSRGGTLRIPPSLRSNVPATLVCAPLLEAHALIVCQFPGHRTRSCVCGPSRAPTSGQMATRCSRSRRPMTSSSPTPGKKMPRTGRGSPREETAQSGRREYEPECGARTVTNVTLPDCGNRIERSRASPHWPSHRMTVVRAAAGHLACRCSPERTSKGMTCSRGGHPSPVPGSTSPPPGRCPCPENCRREGASSQRSPE